MKATNICRKFHGPCAREFRRGIVPSIGAVTIAQMFYPGAEELASIGPGGACACGLVCALRRASFNFCSIPAGGTISRRAHSFSLGRVLAIRTCRQRPPPVLQRL